MKKEQSLTIITLLLLRSTSLLQCFRFSYNLAEGPGAEGWGFVCSEKEHNFRCLSSCETLFQRGFISLEHGSASHAVVWNKSSVLNAELGFIKLWLSAQLSCEFPFLTLNRLLIFLYLNFLSLKCFLYFCLTILSPLIRSYCHTTKFLLASTFFEKSLSIRFERPA